MNFTWKIKIFYRFAKIALLLPHTFSTTIPNKNLKIYKILIWKSREKIRVSGMCNLTTLIYLSVHPNKSFNTLSSEISISIFY